MKNLILWKLSQILLARKFCRRQNCQYLSSQIPYNMWNFAQICVELQEEGIRVRLRAPQTACECMSLILLVNWVYQFSVYF